MQLAHDHTHRTCKEEEEELVQTQRPPCSWPTLLPWLLRLRRKRRLDRLSVHALRPGAPIHHLSHVQVNDAPQSEPAGQGLVVPKQPVRHLGRVPRTLTLTLQFQEEQASDDEGSDGEGDAPAARERRPQAGLTRGAGKLPDSVSVRTSKEEEEEEFKHSARRAAGRRYCHGCSD